VKGHKEAKNRTSQEEGLAPAFPILNNSGGRPLFLTCSILHRVSISEPFVRLNNEKLACV
ncbi:MAG TPA: hypothetical protein VJT69_08795, partial [Pyrinomonadaceae bacterium]|nr:hypothetical protein [Pyrinomonadaceae bacterium]